MKHYRDKNNHIKMLRKFHPAVKEHLTLFLKTNYKYSIILHTQKFKLSFKVEFAIKL